MKSRKINKKSLSISSILKEISTGDQLKLCNSELYFLGPKNWHDIPSQASSASAEGRLTWTLKKHDPTTILGAKVVKLISSCEHQTLNACNSSWCSNLDFPEDLPLIFHCLTMNLLREKNLSYGITIKIHHPSSWYKIDDENHRVLRHYSPHVSHEVVHEPRIILQDFAQSPIWK